jgi:hypothetical protein
LKIFFTGSILNIVKKAAFYLARKEFCKNAIHECVDFSVFKEKHTLPVIVGLFLIVFSSLMVIPSFVAVGLIAAKLKKPMVGVIGIPLAYGISWLLLMLGIYLTGSDYAKALGKWFTRVVLEKILGDEIKNIALNPDGNIEK